MDGLFDDVFERPTQRPRYGAVEGPGGWPWLAAQLHLSLLLLLLAPTEGHADAQQRDDNAAAEAPQVVWLACAYRSGTLGVAAYDQLTNEVHLR
jgi:hypothetical protein